MKLFSICLLALALSFSVGAQVKKPEAPASKPPFSKSLQAVVVTTKDWDSVTGNATLFERKTFNSPWKPTSDTFPVVVGQNGLAPVYGFTKPFNDAPILGAVFAKYCAAWQRRDDLALERVYSAATLEDFRKEMRAERIKSIRKYLEDDRPTWCFADNEEFLGDLGKANIYSDAYPSGIKIQFIKENGEWKMTNESPPLEMLRKEISESKKLEGDGRSPVGLYPLTAIFGASTKPLGLAMPFTKLDQYTECVDDVKSSFYNRIVNRMQVGNFDWKSSEKILAVGEQYELGVFVAYNTYPVENGLGSCIFLHIWKDATSGTAGCTAMERRNLERIVAWLSPKKNPYLVQLPEKMYESRRKTWKLPKLK